MDHPVQYPCYSVDTSALIWLSDEMPPDVYPSVWAPVYQLASELRLIVSEIVVDECKREYPAIDRLFTDYPQVVVGFGPIQEHFASFQRDVTARSTRLTRVDDTRDRADPYVVSAALAAEERDLGDMTVRQGSDRTCTVVTYESDRGGLRKIPNVCKLYSLGCAKWPDVMRASGYVI